MRYALLLILVFAAECTLAQRQVKLKRADNLFGAVKDGERFDRVIGNVIFIQNNTTIYCDSAHFFKKRNRVEAFGQIHITDGDSVDVVARSLSYDGNKRVAYLRKNVVFTKKVLPPCTPIFWIMTALKAKPGILTEAVWSIRLMC